ncbi:MAG: NAD-dependent epimerase [Desulfovibrio sp.]|nr:NAD-dependent epimerase [Desulfovibrio sp.]
MRVLVTGAAGFIGYHLCQRLLAKGIAVTGIDSLNDYYSPQLKRDRLWQLENGPNAKGFTFHRLNIADAGGLGEVFAAGRFTHVVNLAAQAGVRYSLVNPAAYLESNLTGFGNLLEQCRNHSIRHLVYASSSSIYGLNSERPYSTSQNVDHPVSLYAATKKSNELMAHAYSHLYNLPATGLRFFTVYGPWGRPDMALCLFTEAILAGKPISLFNNGKLQRDFTYIDDIVEGVVRVLDKPAQPDPCFDPAAPDPARSSAPWRIYNIGNNNTIELADFVAEIERAVGKKAIKEYLPMQPGDVLSTWADVDDLYNLVGFRPETRLSDGIANYVKWHRAYYGG